MWQNKLMKRIVAVLLLSLTSTAYALPYCPSDQNQRYDNCFGTYTFADGEKYVGGFKDGKYHGQGTYTFVSGRKETGYFMNDEYVPDICEDMGLSKGTSEFGQCVLKLIDKL